MDATCSEGDKYHRIQLWDCATSIDESNIVEKWDIIMTNYFQPDLVYKFHVTLRRKPLLEI